MDDEHRDKKMNLLNWQANLDQAQATAESSVLTVATMYREWHNRGLDQMEAPFLAAGWTWTLGIKHLGEEERHG